MGEWQDMDSAPTDGRAVLLWCGPISGSIMAAWDKRRCLWVEAWMCEDKVVGYTHWRPLPAPPPSLKETDQ